MQDQLTDHLNQQLKSTSLENFSDYLKNLQQLPSLQDFFSVYIAKATLLYNMGYRWNRNW